MGHRFDRQTVHRLAIVTGLTCTFLIVGSVNQPQPSLAGLDASPTDRLMRPTVSADLPPARCLGTIEGRTVTLTVFTGPTEPVYTVHDAKGTLLATGLTASELLAAHPERPELETLLATATDGEALMLAPSDSEF